MIPKFLGIKLHLNYLCFLIYTVIEYLLWHIMSYVPLFVLKIEFLERSYYLCQKLRGHSEQFSFTFNNNCKKGIDNMRAYGRI